MELIEVDAGHVVFDAADPLGNKAGIYIFKIIPNITRETGIGGGGNESGKRRKNHGKKGKRNIT